MKNTDLKEALKEARDLLEGMQEVAADARRMAETLADNVRGFADLQCDAVDTRVADLRRRLDALERKVKPA